MQFLLNFFLVSITLRYLCPKSDQGFFIPRLKWFFFAITARPQRRRGRLRAARDVGPAAEGQSRSQRHRRWPTHRLARQVEAAKIVQSYSSPNVFLIKGKQFVRSWHRFHSSLVVKMFPLCPSYKKT